MKSKKGFLDPIKVGIIILVILIVLYLLKKYGII